MRGHAAHRLGLRQKRYGKGQANNPRAAMGPARRAARVQHSGSCKTPGPGRPAATHAETADMRGDDGASDRADRSSYSAGPHPEDGYQRSVMCLAAWLITNAGAGLCIRMRRGNSLISAAWPRFAAQCGDRPRDRCRPAHAGGMRLVLGARWHGGRSSAPACLGWLGSLGVS